MVVTWLCNFEAQKPGVPDIGPAFDRPHQRKKARETRHKRPIGIESNLTPELTGSRSAGGRFDRCAGMVHIRYRFNLVRCISRYYLL